MRRCADCGKLTPEVCHVERLSTMSKPLSEGRATFLAELCRGCYDSAEAAYCFTHGTKPRSFAPTYPDVEVRVVEAAQAKRARKAERLRNQRHMVTA